MTMYVDRMSFDRKKSFESLGPVHSTPLKAFDQCSHYNMNFTYLSNQLTSAKKKNKQLERQGFRRVNSTVSIAGSGVVKSFAEELDKEVEKIVMFYLNAQGMIAKNCWRLREAQVAALDDIDSITISKIDMFRER